MTCLNHCLKNWELRFGGGTARAMGYADDKNLIVEISQGLQALIEHLRAYLLQCGMKINQAKSHTVSIVGLGKEKKAVVDARQTFAIDGLPIRALSRVDGWTYLEILFTLQGQSVAKLKSKLVLLLNRLTKAPFQAIVTSICLEGIPHSKSLPPHNPGRVTISSLNEINKTVRGFVRQWIALPNDTPTAYFHASVAEG